MPISGQRVLIFSKPFLFARGLSRLIEESGLIVVGLESRTDDALAHIQRLQPDIIILDDTVLSPLLLTSLLDCAPTVRVIRLGLEGNLIRVYDKHQLNASHAQDLVNILSVPQEPSGSQRKETKTARSSEGEHNESFR